MDTAFDDEVEPTVTINEYLEGLEAAELEADMVLGGDEGKECTYSNGYMKRQAVFSCLTCVPAGNTGVCTACSLACHDGHEVVELWTKRNFRCDCGNSKFGEFKCKLLANKELENSENSYNQNFKGSYCTCHRPYPDPEAEEQVEMIQCCMCEDWFHENHIGLESSEEIPRDDEGEPLYGEFICQDCAVKVSFLKSYPPSIWAAVSQNGTVVNVQEMITSINGPTDENSYKIMENESPISKSSLDCTADANCIIACASGKDLQSDSSVGNSSLKLGTGVFERTTSDQNCLIGVDLNATAATFDKKGPMLLSRKWRDHLCRCELCCQFYTKSGIHFLIDEEDSMEEYEKKAKQKREENLQKQEGAEMKFIDTLDHVQKIEILNGIADMKNELSSFLESFDSSKPITTADIHGIFENLAKKRRQI